MKRRDSEARSPSPPLKRLMSFALTFCVLLAARPSHAQDCGDREIDVSVLIGSASGDLFSYVRLLSALPASDDTVLAVYGWGDYTGASPNFVEYDVTWTVPRCREMVWVESNVVVQHFLSPDMIFLSENQAVDMTVPGQWDFQMEEGSLFLADIQIQTAGDTGFTDTDGDGLSDCEEQDGGIDVNCDGELTIGEDVLFDELHHTPADPAVPDIYVEVDWADCGMSFTNSEVNYGPCTHVLTTGSTDVDRRSFKPPQEVLDRIEAEFERNGFALHFQLSNAFPATMPSGVYVDPNYNPEGAPGPLVDVVYNITVPDLTNIRNRYFGKVGENQAVVDVKREFMRYNVWGQARKGNREGGRFGLAPPGSDAFFVQLDVNEPAEFDVAYAPGGQTAGQIATWDQSYQLWAILNMHELGHSLGLGHGGTAPNPDGENVWDDQNYKPNYHSIMNYLYRDSLAGDQRSTAMPQLRFNEVDRSVNQCLTDPETEAAISDGGLAEIDPFSAVEQFTGHFACPDKSRNSWLGDDVDWDCDGMADQTQKREFDIVPFECSTYTGDQNPPSRVGDDVLYGAMIQNQEPSFLPNSIPEGDDEPSGYFIIPGPDNILQTPLAAGDQEIGGFISPGDDRFCNTLAATNDIDLFKRCEVTALSDWENLNVQLLIPRNGNSATGPLGGDNIEPTLEEVLDKQKRNAVADLAIEAAIGEFDASSREVEITFTLVNSSFDPASYVGINLNLPAGTEVAGCYGDGAFSCLPYDGLLSAGIAELPGLSTVQLIVKLLVSCSAPGETFEIRANAVSLSRDPELSDNHVSVQFEVEDPLKIGNPQRPWVIQHSGGQPVPVNESSAALALGCGNLQFESPTFDTLELGSVGTALEVDVFVPSGGWPGWVGDLQLHLDVPAGNVWNAWVGYQNLGEVPQGIWATVSFPLTTEARAALLGDFPDARLRFASNVSSCSHQVLFRNVRFNDALTCQEVPSTPPARVSSSILQFESISDWTGESAELAQSATRTQGAGATVIDPSGWGRMVSREFAASELASVTSTIAFDVRIPDLPSDYYWLGGLNFFLDCPNVGLWNRWVGYQALQILYDDEFNTVQFELPNDVMSALTNSVAECRVAIEFSSNPQFGGFIVDNGGFIQ